jgi:hypothetical protein
MIFLKSFFALSFAIVAFALPVAKAPVEIGTLSLHQCHLRSSIDYVSTQILLEPQPSVEAKTLRSLTNSAAKRTLMVMLSGLSNLTWLKTFGSRRNPNVCLLQNNQQALRIAGLSLIADFLGGEEGEKLVLVSNLEYSPCFTLSQPMSLPSMGDFFFFFFFKPLLQLHLDGLQFYYAVY